MKSRDRATLIALTLVVSWLGTQAVHEAGHVAGAWATGARVERVVLHPLTISRTDVSENSRPLIVVWLGPIVGVVVPVVLWGVAAALRMPGAFVLRFFAGVCLIANGGYLAFGSLGRVGDCLVLLANGAPMWSLWLFGAVTMPCGFALWHGLGPDFGLGPAPRPIDRRVLVGTAIVAAALLALGIATGR